MKDGDISNRGQEVVAIDLSLVLVEKKKVIRKEGWMEWFRRKITRAPEQPTYVSEIGIDQKMQSLISDLGNVASVFLITDKQPTEVEQYMGMLDNVCFRGVVYLHSLFDVRQWLMYNRCHFCMSNIPQNYGAADSRVFPYSSGEQAAQTIWNYYGVAIRNAQWKT